MLTDSLISYWKLDETSGTRYDSVRSSANNLTDNNTVTQGTGKIGKAASFAAASSEYLSAATNIGSFDVGTAFSVAAWINPTLDSADHAIVANTWSNAGWMVRVTSGNKIRFILVETGVNYNGYDSSVLSAGWHYVVATYDGAGGAVKVYVDGVLDNATQISNGTVTTFSTSNPITIGQTNEAGNEKYYDGLIDEVGIWSRVLTGTEITQLYNAGTGYQYPFTDLSQLLVSYWKLDEASGTRADANYVNDLTDNNTVTQTTGKINNAGQFTAANSEYLSRVDNDQISTGDIDFTLAAWVYHDTKTATQVHISKRATPAGAAIEHMVRYNSASDRFQFTVGDGTTSQTLNADNFGSPSTGTWYYIVAWHDATANTINIQVNNGTANSAAETVTIADQAGSFYMGVAADTQYMDGRIDETAFWKRVLTADERTSLYNSGAGLAWPLSPVVAPTNEWYMTFV